jgi:SNF2 family DNA or RNA helicase
VNLTKQNNKFILSCGFDDRDFAKFLGFLWNPVTREWWTNKLTQKVVDYADRGLVTVDSAMPEFDNLRDKWNSLRDRIHTVQGINQDSRLVKRLIGEHHLYKEQAVTTAKALTMERFCFFCETGTGKTRMALTTLRELKARAIIVCPLSLINVWIAEGEKINVKIKNLRSDKESASKDAHGAINYEQFKKYKKQDMEVYEAIVIDESSKLKDPASQITKFCCGVSENFKYAFLLSGTPAPNSPLEFWGQSFVVDPEILGDNYYKFRRTFAVACGFENREFYVSPEKRQKIAERLAPYCSYLKKEEIVDLPEKTFEIIDIDLNKDETTQYQSILKEKIAVLKNETVIAPNIITEMMKLRQITSGFMYTTHDGNLKPLSIGTSKLNALDDLLESFGKSQAIVFTNFREELNMIWSRRNDVACIYGGQAESDRTSAVNLFQTGVKRVLVANIESAARGFTFINASYIVFFSLHWSGELFAQAQDRIHRIGQHKKCTYYILNGLSNGKKTIDHRIWRSLNKKTSIQSEILEMIKEYEGINSPDVD